MDVVEFTWAVPASQARQTAHDLVSPEGSVSPDLTPFTPPPDEERDYGSAAFEPLLVISGAIALGYLIDKVVKAVRDVRHGGAIIDVREGHIDVRSTPALPADHIVVIDGQGVHQLDSSRPSEVKDLIQAAALPESAS